MTDQSRPTLLLSTCPDRTTDAPRLRHERRRFSLRRAACSSSASAAGCGSWPPLPIAQGARFGFGGSIFEAQSPFTAESGVVPAAKAEMIKILPWPPHRRTRVRPAEAEREALTRFTRRGTPVEGRLRSRSRRLTTSSATQKWIEQFGTSSDDYLYAMASLSGDDGLAWSCRWRD